MESLPLWGKVARNVPDEGEMSGRRNKLTHTIAIAVKPRAAYMPPLQTNP